MLLFVSVLGLLVFRITNSLELGDEVYNASFVDDGLKGGIATSTFLVLHQTAGLLSYPFAMAFNYATGSTDGLLVFLRILFLCGNLVAAASLYFFLHKTIGASCAFVAMLAMLSFIPSGAAQQRAMPRGAANFLLSRWPRWDARSARRPHARQRCGT